MSYSKKGQAALEFLTTYGWAFLVILVMIGALAYFGVLDPQRFLPQRCQFGQELYCQKYALSVTNGAAFSLRNNLPNDIVIPPTGVAFNTNDADVYADTCTIGGGDVTLSRNTETTILCPALDIGGQLTAGQKQRVRFRVTYSEPDAGGAYDPVFAKTLFGEVYANVGD